MKKKIKKIYRYECTITGETFKTTAEAPSPGNLSTVSSFYEMHPEKDDRPQDTKIRMKEMDEKLKLEREERERMAEKFRQNS